MKNGLDNFHNIQRDLRLHENSKDHVSGVLNYRMRAKESQNTLDASVVNQTDRDVAYWRSILQRIIAVIKFLGARGLAFRGANQQCGSDQNGNFLGILDLLSEFDPLVANHIARYGNKGAGSIDLDSYLSIIVSSPFWDFECEIFTGRASYLSDTICDEFCTKYNMN